MLVMLSFVITLLTTVQQEWVWSMHPESGFRILAPVVLNEEVTDIPTEADVIKFHQFRGGSVTDTVLSMAFVVDYHLMPVMIEEKDDAYLKDFFENSIDPVLNALSGSLVYMDIEQQADRDVCSWKATYRNGEGMVRGNAILTHGKYYGLQVFGWTKNKPETLMNKFIDSFKIIETP